MDVIDVHHKKFFFLNCVQLIIVSVMLIKGYYFALNVVFALKVVDVSKPGVFSLMMRNFKQSSY